MENNYYIKNGIFFKNKSEIYGWVKNRINKIENKADNYYDPFLLKGMTETINMIHNAIKNNRTIVIFSDYDADGVTGGLIMFQGIKKIFDNIILKMSKRKRGYGISKLDIQEIYKEFPNSLIITVDNGIKSLEEVKMCKKMGLDIIVTDHHSIVVENGKEILPNCIVINPLQTKCKYPNKNLSGACVALKVIQALLPNNFEEYLYLAAISIVSDVVSVLGENRLILKKGLEQIHKEQLPVEMLSFLYDANKELMKKNGKNKDIINTKTLNEETIAYYLAPMINAAGRLYSAQIACDVLMGKLPAKTLVNINFERQKKTKIIMDKIKNKIRINGNLAFVCDAIEEGLIGILAGKIKEEYSNVKFSVVLSSIDGKSAKGSIRSDFISVEKTLNSCTNLIDKFGGHERAGGVSLNLNNIEEFYLKLSDIVNRETQEKKVYIDLPLKNDSLIDLEVISWINLLAPFGTDNPKPLVMVEITPQKYFYMGMDKSHVKFLLASASQAVFFNGTKEYLNIGEPKNFKALGYLTINEYNERYTPLLNIKEIKNII